MDAPTGLPAALFALLDAETDGQLRRHISDTVTALLTSLAHHQPHAWLLLCKQVLCRLPSFTGFCAKRSPWSPPPTGADDVGRRDAGGARDAATVAGLGRQSRQGQRRRPSRGRRRGAIPRRWCRGPPEFPLKRLV